MIGRRLLPVPLVLAAVLAVGCGDERTATVASEDHGADTEHSASAGSGEHGGAGLQGLYASIGKDVKTAPGSPKTAGEPPAELVKHDVVAGKGTAAKVGDDVEVRYQLTVWGADGQVVDSSWQRGQPATFPLQSGGLIEGWIQGVPGMKVGGRRILVVPPDLGYGPAGQPPAIPANATLVFVIDLVGIGKGG